MLFEVESAPGPWRMEAGEVDGEPAVIRLVADGGRDVRVADYC